MKLYVRVMLAVRVVCMGEIEERWKDRGEVDGNMEGGRHKGREVQ